MQLKPFLLDTWLDAYEHDIEFNLAASEGPSWTVHEILALAGDEERERFLQRRILYGHPAGADGLRAAIADAHGVSPDTVLAVGGASEALLLLMWDIADPGANVIVPSPGYAPFSAIPESLGMSTRSYPIRRENGFRIDVDEITTLADANTALIVVNTPHHPTGTVLSDGELDTLHEFASSRGIQLVSNEVYHPIYHGPATRSAARLPRATTIGDFSKAFALPGLRVGWIIEHDRERWRRYWNARALFSISNNTAGEALAEVAMRSRKVIFDRTQRAAATNLRQLEVFMAEHADTFGWIAPRGGMTAFPWLLSGEDGRAFCQGVVRRGVLLAPGDCWDAPSHFRLGFGAVTDGFASALDRIGEFLGDRKG
jgi:aspartate/methionine/tyrosine aminotransferase